MPAPRAKKLKKTSFVPRGLFVGAIATGVVPLCACGGAVAQQATVAGMAFDGGDGATQQGFDTGVFTVARAAFDAGADTGIGFTVAACCFDAAFDVATVAFDAGSDATLDTPILGVAATGFDSSVPDSGDGGLGFSVGTTAFDGGQ